MPWSYRSCISNRRQRGRPEPRRAHHPSNIIVPMNSTFTIAVPYLHTERLLLREYRREDFDVFAAHLADPVSAFHLGGGSPDGMAHLLFACRTVADSGRRL